MPRGPSTAPFSIIGIFVGASLPIMLAVAIFMDGTWTFNVNTLSDLGVSDNQVAADLFNASCILGGLLIALVGFGKITLEEDLDVTVGYTLVIAGALLFLVGIFIKGEPAHIPLAILFFIFATCAIIISMISDYRKKRRMSATISSILIVIAFGSMPGFNYAGVEVIAMLCIYSWFIVQGLTLAFSKSEGPKKATPRR